MKYEFEKVLDGLSIYIDKEIYPGMNDLQEFAARIMLGRLINNRESVKDTLINNGFVRTFGVIDNEGMVDVDSLANDIKREIVRKEKITLNIPMFGKMTFKPSDVDILYQNITGEELSSNESN